MTLTIGPRKSSLRPVEPLDQRWGQLDVVVEVDRRARIRHDGPEPELSGVRAIGWPSGPNTVDGPEC